MMIPTAAAVKLLLVTLLMSCLGCGVGDMASNRRTFSAIVLLLKSFTLSAPSQLLRV